MDDILRKGNIILIVRLQADFIGIVDELKPTGEVVYRRMDAPVDSSTLVKAKSTQVVKLSEAQERMMPREFLEAVKKQREWVFKPKTKPTLTKTKKKSPKSMLAEVVAKGDTDTLDKLLAMMMEESDEGGEE